MPPALLLPFHTCIERHRQNEANHAFQLTLKKLHSMTNAKVCHLESFYLKHWLNSSYYRHQWKIATRPLQPAEGESHLNFKPKIKGGKSSHVALTNTSSKSKSVIRLPQILLHNVQGISERMVLASFGKPWGKKLRTANVFALSFNLSALPCSSNHNNQQNKTCSPGSQSLVKAKVVHSCRPVHPLERQAVHFP